jgi:hypothetical protein
MNSSELIELIHLRRLVHRTHAGILAHSGVTDAVRIVLSHSTGLPIMAVPPAAVELSGTEVVLHLPDDADHLAIAVDNGARFEPIPHHCAITRDKPQILCDASATLLNDLIKRGAIAVAIGVVDHLHQLRSTAIKSATLQPKLHLKLRREMKVIITHIPIENDVATANKGERLALGIGNGAAGYSA